MEKRVKALIFDVGGVLSLGKISLANHRGHHCLGVHEYVAKKLKFPIDQYFDSIDGIYSKSFTGEISEEKAISQLSKNLKTTPQKLIRYYIKGYNKNFKINKRLYKLAFKLKKQGQKIAILSDQWCLSKKAHKLIDEKLIREFDVVILSCDARMRKPNPKIYRLILKKLKLKPPEVIFIDNLSWNLVPAKKLGMNTVLFKNNGQLFEQLSKWGIE